MHSILPHAGRALNAAFPHPAQLLLPAPSIVGLLPARCAPDPADAPISLVLNDHRPFPGIFVSAACSPFRHPASWDAVVWSSCNGRVSD